MQTMADQVQHYGNHRRFVPLWHAVTAGILLLNVAYSIMHLVRHGGDVGRPYGAIVGLLVAIALVLMWGFARGFATKVQDRVIRLEESMRYDKVLPGDLKGRAAQLTIRQIIGLRFASDGELPALVRRALDERLTENQIKKEVKNWKADMLRA
jgi:predicted Co/Zn/Cd cation transporter (cation efflux family)